MKMIINSRSPSVMLIVVRNEYWWMKFSQRTTTSTTISSSSSSSSTSRATAVPVGRYIQAHVNGLICNRRITTVTGQYYHHSTNHTHIDHHIHNKRFHHPRTSMLQLVLPMIITPTLGSSVMTVTGHHYYYYHHHHQCTVGLITGGGGGSRRCKTTTTTPTTKTTHFTNKMRHSTQQSDFATQHDLILIADTLLDLKKFPIGTYTSKEYSKIKNLLYYYIHLDKPTCKEAVNQPIDVIVRLAQEVAYIVSIHEKTDESDQIQRELGDNITSNHHALPNTLAVTSNPKTYEWILNANYYNPIMTTWKNNSLNIKDRFPGIYTGLDLIQKVQYMSKILPPTIYKVNIITITMILQVVIKQVRRDEAPIICEKLLHIMSQQLQRQKELGEMTNMRTNKIGVRIKREMELYEPNMFSFNILLKAWAESRLDVASEKIKMIVQEIKEKYNLELGEISYKILLRYYSRIGDVDNVNDTLQQMHVKKLPIDVDCLTQALKCCCRAGQIDNAHTILNMIIHQHPNNAERTMAIKESIQHMVLAYRNRLDTVLAQESTVLQKAGDNDLHNTQQDDVTFAMSLSSSMNNNNDDDTMDTKSLHDDNTDAIQEQEQRAAVAEVIRDTIQRLQDLSNVVKTVNVLDQHALDSMFEMMLELYIRSNLLTNARELVRKELPRSIEAHCSLLQGYCVQNQVQAATRMLYEFIQNVNMDDPRMGIIPNTQMFNIVIEALGKSNQIDDAYEQISTLFDTLQNHSICRRYKIRPNKYTYMLVLESLISLEVPDGAVKAEAILGEMEQSFNQSLFSDHPDQLIDVNQLVKPDVDIYMIVMKAWIQSSDCDRALDILRRMEKFTDIVPDKQMYYDLLHYYAKAGTEKAAESAEQIFKLMKASYEPQYHAYSLLTRVWLKSGSTKAADKVWSLYCEMTEYNMRPDQPLYLQLIQLLTAKRELSYIRDAHTVLDDIEEYNRKYLVPTHYTMLLMAYLEVDEVDFAIQILSKFVQKFGHRDHQLVPIMTQLIKLWIDRGEYKKATMLVNSMQEFTDAGLLQEGVNCNVFVLLKAAWVSSNDPDKDFVIAQIDDIIHHLSRPEEATIARTNDSSDISTTSNDTTGGSNSSQSSLSIHKLDG